jgi:hypothetical protein
MARASGLSQTAVSCIWRAFGLQPHRQETFKLSTDPQFVAKTATSLDCTSIRRPRHWCCASMRRVKFRR